MRILIILLLLYIAYRFLKAKGILPSASRDLEKEDTPQKEAELIQDPQCGAYFLKHQGIEARIDGQTLHFCSESCRNSYIEKHRTQ